MDLTPIYSIAQRATGMTIDQLRAKAIEPDYSRPGDFRDADGILICGECGMPRESVCVSDDGTERRYEVIHFHDLESERAKEDIESLRAKCFSGYEAFASATFETVDVPHADKLMAYVGSFEELKRDGRGFIFYGLSGRGKSTAAACILNALMNRKVRCKMTSITSLMEPIELKAQKIAKLRDYGCICIDDYGSERTTSYGKETGFEVINRLYAMGKPVIVTTNLTEEQLRRPPVEYAKSIDRLKQKCERVAFDGPNFRQVSM